MELVAFSPGTVTLTLRAEDSPFIDLAPPAGPTVTLSAPNTQLVLEVGTPGPVGPVGPAGATGPAGTSGVVAATAPLSYNSGTQTLSIDLSAYETASHAAATYYPVSNPAGYLTSASLSGYATQSWVTAGFYPLGSNPANYLTSSALTPYATLASPVFTGDARAVTPATSDWDTSIATTAYVKNQGYATTTALNYNLGFYLPKAGGNMDASATVQYSDSTYDSQIAGWGFGVELTASPSENASIGFNAVTVQDSLGSMQMTSTGLTFPDSTVMTTAAAGGVGYSSPCLTYGGSNITAIDLSSGSLTANYVYGGDLVRASNLTLTSGNGGVLTFEDNTTQSTAFPGYTGTSAQYIAGDGSLITFPTLASANKLTAVVYNETGATLTKGTVVYISGTHGNLPSVSKSQANSEATSAGTYGLVAADIGNMSSGTIVLAGIIENLALNAYADGDKLYLSPTTAGEYTTTKPSAPNHMVFIGVVTRAHPTLGTIQLRIANGFELEELHNVAAQTPSNNDLLAYESSTSLWKNKSFSTLGLLTSSTAASTYAPLASPTFTGTVTIPAGASISGFAPLASPSLTGTPTAPTATVGTNTTQIATTAFVLANAGSGGGGVNVQTFGSSSSSGSFTWTKPTGAKWVEFYLVGGGGGGGSGARYVTTSARAGGGGGGGSPVHYGRISAGVLGATETVVVGAGGSGGASITTDTTAGNNGTAATTTTFSLYTSGLSSSGQGGTTVSGIAGTARASCFVYPVTSASGAGGAGALTLGNTPANVLSVITVPSGGGGGAGAGAASTTNNNGGNGGSFSASATAASSIASISGGIGGIQGGAAATAGTSTTTNYFQAGTGGGGGAYRTATAGGTGGEGGWPGGGGGGGGASDNGFASGAGGKGANGFAVIITYF